MNTNFDDPEYVKKHYNPIQLDEIEFTIDTFKDVKISGQASVCLPGKIIGKPDRTYWIHSVKSGLNVMTHWRDSFDYDFGLLMHETEPVMVYQSGHTDIEHWADR